MGGWWWWCTDVVMMLVGVCGGVIQYNTLQYKHEYYYSGINPAEFQCHSVMMVVHGWGGGAWVGRWCVGGKVVRGWSDGRMYVVALGVTCRPNYCILKMY